MFFFLVFINHGLTKGTLAASFSCPLANGMPPCRQSSMHDCGHSEGIGRPNECIHQIVWPPPSLHSHCHIWSAKGEKECRTIGLTRCREAHGPNLKGQKLLQKIENLGGVSFSFAGIFFYKL
jgi:hypothetical protein